MWLIIQNGDFTPSIPLYMTDDYQIFRSKERDVSRIDLEKYCGLIILGGHQSVLAKKYYDVLGQVSSLIEQARKLDKPILGICLGMHLLALEYDCTVAKGDYYCGFDTKILGHERIFRCHQDHVSREELPDSVEILEEQDGIPYLIRFSRNVVGIQCHPDVNPFLVNNYVFTPLPDHPHDIDKSNMEIIQRLLDMVNPGSM